VRGVRYRRCGSSRGTGTSPARPAPAARFALHNLRRTNSHRDRLATSPFPLLLERRPAVLPRLAAPPAAGLISRACPPPSAAISSRVASVGSQWRPPGLSSRYPVALLFLKPLLPVFPPLFHSPLLSSSVSSLLLQLHSIYLPSPSPPSSLSATAAVGA
jgi:hypothetical protein